jgi:hypothetical protein
MGSFLVWSMYLLVIVFGWYVFLMVIVQMQEEKALLTTHLPKSNWLNKSLSQCQRSEVEHRMPRNRKSKYILCKERKLRSTIQSIIIYYPPSLHVIVPFSYTLLFQIFTFAMLGKDMSESKNKVPGERWACF